MSRLNLTEATIRALQENNNNINLIDYKDTLDKLLDLTMPQNNLSYYYEILEDHITLYCEDGLNSKDDTKAINSLENWCSKFAKKIPNYDKFFTDERNQDWFSGMSFGNNGYMHTNHFFLNIYLEINNKEDDKELDTILNTFTQDELDTEIDARDDKFNKDQLTKLINALSDVGFTKEQIQLCTDLKLQNVTGTDIVKDIKKLPIGDYKDIPLDLMKIVISKYMENAYPGYIQDVFKDLFEGIKLIGIDKITELYKNEDINDVLNKAKEIYRQNIQNNADTNQPDLVDWAKQVIADSNISYIDPYDLVRAINNGYDKDTITDVVNYYKDIPEGYKSRWIKSELIAILAGDYKLDKSQVEYLLDLCRDYSNIKYPQTLPEIIKALENGISIQSVNEILSKYSSTKDIRAEFDKLISNK